MRIIAGVAKGRRLVAPDTRDTRPVTDRVREAVFSLVGTWVEQASVLDLYAGSGAFGLEALSRGAASAVFVENASQALFALRLNIRAVGLGGVVVSTTVQDYLIRAHDTFDLVFSDPPWLRERAKIEEDLAQIDRLTSPQAEIVISRRHSDPQPTPPENWRVATDRRYGDTRILRYEKKADRQ